MTENRELDAFCAEFVMGWKRVKHPWEVVSGTFAIGRDDAIYVLEEFNAVTLFHPTTDRAAAMEVLERCAAECDEQDDEIIINHTKRPNGGAFWDILMREGVSTGTGESLPIAICNFARQLFQPKEGK